MIKSISNKKKQPDNMNKTHAFAMLLMAISFMLFSCEKPILDEEGLDEGPSSEGVTKVINLSCSEEDVSMTQSPMTRAANADGKKYLGINVYEKTDSGYVKYAYGLFDKLSDISMTLVEGKKYKIECVEVINGVDTIYHKGNQYYRPFKVGTQPGELTNSFSYSSKYNLNYLLMGMIEVNDGLGILNNPQLIESYGEVVDFDPQDSSELHIQLKRAVYGLNLVITPPKDGTVDIEYMRPGNIITIQAGDEVFKKNGIYAFERIKDASRDGYSSHFKMVLKWKYSNGYLERDTVRVPVSRNIITTVQLNFFGSAKEKTSFTEEDSDYGNQTFSYTMGKK